MNYGIQIVVSCIGLVYLVCRFYRIGNSVWFSIRKDPKRKVDRVSFFASRMKINKPLTH